MTGGPVSLADPWGRSPRGIILSEEFDLSTSFGLAGAMARVLTVVGDRIRADNAASPLVAAVTGHLGCGLLDLVVVEETYRGWEHAGLYRAIEAYLPEGSAWYGIFGPDRSYGELIDLLTSAWQDGKHHLARPEYLAVPIGPDETMQVVRLGLVPAYAPDGTPVIIGTKQEMGNEGVPIRSILNVLSADQAAAAATRDAIARLRWELDAMRGQVLSFGHSENYNNELVSFLPRPATAAAEVILPDGLLETIEAHVVGIGEQSERLLAAGQHLKRGVLLHGPPGTGKTHTVRYLLGKMPGATAILLTGPAMRYLDFVVALARRLQPAIVVIEDVDLVAEDRSFSDASPLLFTLLDAMDGLATDADVTFVLTTNRAEVLEQALAARPGRVDLAVEIPLPDATGRDRLLRLYARNLRIDADLAPVIADTEGVTASYIKELMRRVVLAALRTEQHPQALSDAHFAAVLAEMREQQLTRAILGGGRASGARPARAALGPACD
jgi:ATPase family associated with various cellular activities (AAA)